MQYPVTATQWHPEKNAFEWARHLDIPHDKGAIAVTEAVANFIVDEARSDASDPPWTVDPEHVVIPTQDFNAVVLVALGPLRSEQCDNLRMIGSDPAHTHMWISRQPQMHWAAVIGV